MILQSLFFLFFYLMMSVHLSHCFPVWLVSIIALIILLVLLISVSFYKNNLLFFVELVVSFPFHFEVHSVYPLL